MTSTTAIRATSESSHVGLMAQYGWTEEQFLAHKEVVRLLEAGVSTKVEMDELIKALIACDDDYEVLFINDNVNNRGGIDMNANPARNFVEAVSNAQDAILELAVLLNGKSPNSINEALALIGMDMPTLRKMSPAEIKDWVKVNEVAVGFSDSGLKTQPTLIVKDRGTGILPSQFACITMLRHGNKSDKGFTIGEHGQGVRTMLPFCRGMVVKSCRHKALLDGRPQDIGVTVLFRSRNEAGRTTFVYVGKEGGEGVSIPMELFNSEQNHGTEMRFIEYDASKFYNYQSAGVNSLYATLETALANSVMPIKMFFEGGSKQNRYVRGIANRLGSQVKRKGDDQNISFHDAMTLQFNGRPLSVETFVVNAKDCSGYVRADSQVLFTLGGQTHGTMSRQWLKKQTNLPFLFKKLIVVVRLDGLGIETLEDILPTTRESLKETSCSQGLKELIVDAISSHADLKALDADARNQISGSSSQEVKEKVLNKVKDKISSFLSKQEFQDVQDRVLVKPTNGGTRGAMQHNDDDSAFGEEPTYIRFTKSEINTSPGNNPWIMINADAKNDFFPENNNRLNLTTTANSGNPSNAQIPSIPHMCALKGGRAWWRLNIPNDCPLGDYTVIAELESIDGSTSLTAEIVVKVKPPKRPQMKLVTRRKLVTVEAPDIEIEWISASDMESVSPNGSRIDPGCVKTGDDFTRIYLNEETDEIRSYLGKVGPRLSMSPQMKESRRQRFEVAFCFGLFRQHFQDSNSESEFPEDRLEQERFNLSQSIMEAVDENWELELGFFNDDD